MRRAGAEGFFEEIGAFDSDQTAVFAQGIGEGAAQLFEACILLTLYNANRHQLGTILVLCRF